MYRLSIDAIIRVRSFKYFHTIVLKNKRIYTQYNFLGLLTRMLFSVPTYMYISITNYCATFLDL